MKRDMDLIRTILIRQKLKAEMKDRGISLPFELIQQLATKIIAGHMGLP